jgi:hypothetical protein
VVLLLEQLIVELGCNDEAHADVSPGRPLAPARRAWILQYNTRFAARSRHRAIPANAVGFSANLRRPIECKSPLSGWQAPKRFIIWLHPAFDFPPFPEITMIRFALLFAAIGLVANLPSAPAQEKKKDPPAVFTDPDKAGPDFKVQGEYAGEVGPDKLGAQVVALGDGKFDVYFLTGGLPGAGWDVKGRAKESAKTGDDKVVIGGKWPGTIADGKLTGKNSEGVAYALKKVLRESSTQGAKPPEGATVLFDGTNADNWSGGKIVEDNLLYRGTNSKKGITTGKLHVEFRTPFQPKARGQGRGNSGVFIHGVEIQVLDSFGLTGANNECGAFYGSRKPDVNMCYPPLSWQTFDVDIKLNEKDEIVATVLHNGVKVHENFVLKKGPVKPASINLQDHGNPVVYRNIWFAEMK